MTIEDASATLLLASATAVAIVTPIDHTTAIILLVVMIASWCWRYWD